MTNEVQKTAADKKKLLTEKVLGNFTQNEINVISKTIAKDATPEQFNLFINTAVASGLNPLLNHIYCIIYGGRMSIQVSVEGIAHLARSKKEFKGYDSQVVCENDEFEAGMLENEWIIKKHNIKFPRGKVIGAYAIAKKEGFENVVILMDVEEVKGMSTGTNAKMWKSYFEDMLKKHVLKRALKQQFGIEINEDQPQIQQESYTPGARKEITPDAPTVTTGENEDDTQENLKSKLHAEIMDNMDKWNINDEELNKIVLDKFNAKAEDLSLPQLAALNRFVEFEGKDKKRTTNEQMVEPEQAEEQLKDEIDELGDLFNIE
jgi:recombination protein RecT